MNRDEMMISRHKDAAVDAADSSAYASTIHEVAHDDKHTSTCEDQAQQMSTRTDSLFVTLNREELRSLILVEVKSAVKDSKGE